MNRREANQALAKVIAYLECGKPANASEWADRLVGMIRAAGVGVQ
jgi:hypothetical protein